MADDHPFIIKMPDLPPPPENGIGYEIFHAMKQNSDKVAQYIASTGESQTHGELLDKCIRVAINLSAENLTNNDMVGLFVRNHKNSCIPYVAALFLGKKVAAFDPNIELDEKRRVLEKARPKIIFVDEGELSSVEKSLKIADLSIKLVVIGNKTGGYESFDDFLKASDDDVMNFQPKKVSSIMDTAIIFFSSGTTGVPKGICTSHYGILTRTSGFRIAVGLAFVQLSWISYAVFIMNTLRHGSAIVLIEKFGVTELWNAIHKYRINMVFIKVYQLAKFCLSTKPESIDTSCLKIIVTGGAAMPKEILFSTMKLLPEVAVLQGYGMTEVCGLAFVFKLQELKHREWQLEKPTSCGTPIEGFWYKVADPETDEILGPNKRGELRLKTKLMMVGYHNMDSTEAFDKDGWLKTGDIVEYDEDHCFFIVDRIKDIIICRDWVISPSYLEQVLSTHPAVYQAAVIGFPVPEDFEHAMGIVQLKDGYQVVPEELQKFVEERVLEKYWLLGGVKIIKEMPFSSTGKILKRTLKKMVINGEL